MTLRHNTSQFVEEIRTFPERIVRSWREGAVELGTLSYGALLERTEGTESVDTGAYRGEHVIEQDGSTVYKNPDSVGPDRILPRRKPFGLDPLIDAPSLADVRADLQARLRPAGFSFVNRRSYAEDLEDGSALVEPRQIYATSRDATELIAQRVAQEISSRPMSR